MTKLTGRQLDAEIAQKIFGHTMIWVDDHSGVGHPYLLASELNGADYVRNYSTDIAAAWQVVEHLIAEKNAYIEIQREIDSQVLLAFITVPGKTFVTGSAYAPTAPEAICRAALELVEMMAEKTGN